MRRLSRIFRDAVAFADCSVEPTKDAELVKETLTPWINWFDIMIYNDIHAEKFPKKCRNMLIQMRLIPIWQSSPSFPRYPRFFKRCLVTIKYLIAKLIQIWVSSHWTAATSWMAPQLFSSKGHQSEDPSSSLQQHAVPFATFWTWNPTLINWLVVSNIFYFHPCLGKIPILTNIFRMGWNHQLVNPWIFGTFPPTQKMLPGRHSEHPGSPSGSESTNCKR